MALVLVGVISFAFSSGAYLGSLGPIRNPLAIEGFSEVYEMVWSIMFPLFCSSQWFYHCLCECSGQGVWSASSSNGLLTPPRDALAVSSFDGQQRLATTLILLSAIRNAYSPACSGARPHQAG